MGGDVDELSETDAPFSLTVPKETVVARHVDFAARIAIGYLLISIIWILASDRLVIWLLPAGNLADWVQSAKGIIFVSITALALYLVVHLYVKRLAKAREDLQAAWDQTLLGWAMAIDAREKATGLHSQRVAKLTVLLAKQMRIKPADLTDIYRGALLHDIGKIGVPDAVLLAPGPLTVEQWAIMRQHPEIGMRMLAPIEFLKNAIDIPYCHHERWDGSGYPRGLKGNEIPLAARIFAVVDVFDAVTSDRSYRSPLPTAEAMELVRGETGTLLDPQVVAAFETLMAQQARATSTR